MLPLYLYRIFDMDFQYDFVLSLSVSENTMASQNAVRYQKIKWTISKHLNSTDSIELADRVNISKLEGIHWDFAYHEILFYHDYSGKPWHYVSEQIV